MSQSVHIAVMVEEAMRWLDPQPGAVVIDATLGGGTHTAHFLDAVGPKGLVVSFDVDREALARAAKRFVSYKKCWLGIESNFRHLIAQCEQQGIREVDCILADLGYSSDELENPAIGLSFLREAPLDMRFGPQANDDGLTAADIVNHWSESEIADAIFLFGEEKQSRKIARAIIEARRRSRIETTTELAGIIRTALGKGYERGRIDPATRTFQALRIAVNDELDALKDLLKGAETLLKPHGRIGVISFHSLEDRIVKQAFQTSNTLTQITKKPIEVSEDEARKNPRARSAKIRVAEKT
ncbi:16S rRNA (cytosine(1402)-N(4))-methyltransferase RsmH [Candidatus Uhrbacteria bacterium]|nr:16S rRNA (cytosine(1402)-N(4))-methyltransferase RsmH [Candidatus Uhrbacteria bacterium]